MPSKKSKSTARPARVSKSTVRVHIHPEYVEIYGLPGCILQDRPASVIANGGEGSDAAAKLASTLKNLRRNHNVTVKNFDASGKEVTP